MLDRISEGIGIGEVHDAGQGNRLSLLGARRHPALTGGASCGPISQR